MTAYDEIRARNARYDELLAVPEGDGSLVGRYFIIAKSRGTDIDTLLTAIDKNSRAVHCATYDEAPMYLAKVALLQATVDDLVKALKDIAYDGGSANRMRTRARAALTVWEGKG